MARFSWQVEMQKGSLYLPQIGLWCDAHHPTSFSFVSHAHFDHLASHERVIASTGTNALMQARLGGEREVILLPLQTDLESGEHYAFDPQTELRLFPAGHIFGSAMIHLSREGQRFLYTGDFKLRPGRSAERCVVPPAEVVVMETTFGLPKYQFPPTEIVIAQMVAFCQDALDDGQVPILFGYSLGKSQEIISSLAEAGLPIMLHPQTEKMTRVYVELGAKFPAFRSFSLEESPGHVVICPPQANQSSWLRKIKKRRTAAVTGWAMDSGAIYRYQCDAAFPLSDHADYNDLLRFVELVQPKQVWTVHGHTQAFARTLRERGIEAWPMGEDSQLELPLQVFIPAQKPAEPPAVVLEVPSPIELPADDVQFLAQVAETVRLTPGKLAKVSALAAYFRTLTQDDALGATALALTGRAFPTGSGRVLQTGWAVIKRAVLQLSGLTETDLRAIYLRYSDSGETVGEALIGKTKPEAWSISELPPFFDRLAQLRGPLEKSDFLRDRLARLNPMVAKYMVKIITGDLRIGLKEGLVEEALAEAFGRTVEDVKEGNMLSGDLAVTAISARNGSLGALQLRSFQPIQCMLASPKPTAEAILERFQAIGEVWLEEKFDGIRCQVHKAGQRVELYSRELRCISGQFPDLVEEVRKIPCDFVADGELLAWQKGRALPFAELQKRLGRKGDDLFLGAEIPVSLCLFDLLGVNGTSLLKEPLQVRRAQLEDLPLPAQRVDRAGVERVKTAVAIEAAFLRARSRGNEGLMAKDPASLYLPGRRDLYWFKLKKAYATLDVVVVGVEWGHGKRKGVLSDYTFAVRDEGKLLTVGKAYSGLTDAEIAQYTEYFLEHTVTEKGRYREVVPEVILEVAFDTIQASKRHGSGFALRFPRIVRIRQDKTVGEIDTLAYCRELAAGALGVTSGADEKEEGEASVN